MLIIYKAKSKNNLIKIEQELIRSKKTILTSVSDRLKCAAVGSVLQKNKQNL